MNVLYVSKALVVAAYRAKLAALARHVEVRGVMPERWGPSPPEPVENGGPPLRRWPVVLHGHNHLHLYRRAGRLLGRPLPDLLHVDEEPYSAATFQLLRRSHQAGVPAVFFTWQNLNKRLPPPFSGIRRYAFRTAAGALAGTRTAAQVLRAQGFRGPLEVVPQFGVCPRRFRPDPVERRRIRGLVGAGEADFLVGFGGRLVPEKGVGILLEAVASLPGVRLLVVGAGPEGERLRRAAREAGVRERVHFAGHRPSTEMPGWLAACDAVVLPSVGRRGWVEQFGRILVEAMACGVPVVGSRVGEIPQVVGEAGLTVPPGDPAALAASLRALAASTEERDRLGTRGRERVLGRYTHERIAARTAAFYRKVAP